MGILADKFKEIHARELNKEFIFIQRDHHNGGYISRYMLIKNADESWKYGLTNEIIDDTDIELVYNIGKVDNKYVTNINIITSCSINILYCYVKDLIIKENYLFIMSPDKKIGEINIKGKKITFNKSSIGGGYDLIIEYK